MPQSDFQQKLREHLVNSLQFPRNIEFFVAECDQFLNDKQNLIKALHPTEVIPEAIYLPKIAVLTKIFFAECYRRVIQCNDLTTRFPHSSVVEY